MGWHCQTPWGREPQVYPDGCHCDEQVYNGDMGEKEEQSGSCTVERSSTEDMMKVRNSLIWVIYAAT